MSENPDASLFTTYERMELCHRVEVTEDNLHALAQHFGWSVSYSAQRPRLVKPDYSVIDTGAWLDQRGSRGNPEPLTQGWFPEGTFTAHPEHTTTEPTKEEDSRA